MATSQASTACPGGRFVLAALALQVILSAVFLVAATKKTLRSEQFFVTLRLSHQPAGSIMPIGVAVPALELALAMALLLAPARNAVEALAFLRLVLPRFGRACRS